MMNNAFKQNTTAMIATIIFASLFIGSGNPMKSTSQLNNQKITPAANTQNNASTMDLPSTAAIMISMSEGRPASAGVK